MPYPNNPNLNACLAHPCVGQVNNDWEQTIGKGWPYLLNWKVIRLAGPCSANNLFIVSTRCYPQECVDQWHRKKRRWISGKQNLTVHDQKCHRWIRVKDEQIYLPELAIHALSIILIQIRLDTFVYYVPVDRTIRIHWHKFTYTVMTRSYHSEDDHTTTRCHCPPYFRTHQCLNSHWLLERSTKFAKPV